MIIEIENLKKQYKNQQVLKGIQLHIETPQIIALVGPNGAGKTTLMNCMMNLLPYQAGSIQLLGKSPSDYSLFYEVSYMQDNRVLYGDLTGWDHLQMMCDIHKLPKSSMDDIAKRVGIVGYLKKRVRSYSLGMKQHLLFALAIINKPKLLLMDEPLNGLDPTSAINMRDILLDLHSQGTTILISSHNLDAIDRLTKTIYFMKDGALLKESMDDFSTTLYKLKVSDPPKTKQVLLEKGFCFHTSSSDEITFEESKLPLSDVLGTLYAHQIQVLAIQNEYVGAERRYLELFESELHL